MPKTNKQKADYLKIRFQLIAELKIKPTITMPSRVEGNKYLEVVQEVITDLHHAGYLWQTGCLPDSFETTNEFVKQFCSYGVVAQ